MIYFGSHGPCGEKVPGYVKETSCVFGVPYTSYSRKYVKHVEGKSWGKNYRTEIAHDLSVKTPYDNLMYTSDPN